MQQKTVLYKKGNKGHKWQLLAVSYSWLNKPEFEESRAEFEKLKFTTFRKA